jgi:hypothetical protein
MEMVEANDRIMSILEMGQHMPLAVIGSASKQIVCVPIPVTFTFSS